MVFVIDAASSERFAESKAALEQVRSLEWGVGKVCVRVLFGVSQRV